MALKPTIYKLKVQLSDMNRDYYDSLSFTVAQHPSETVERMMVRVLAYCLNAQEFLTFTTGLSEPDEPDLKIISLDGRLVQWIDVGEPAVERIKKATRLAEAVRVYSFNSKADAWWRIEGDKFADLPVDIYRMDWPGIQALAGLVQRTMNFTMTISEECAYITLENGACDVSWQILQSTHR